MFRPLSAGVCRGARHYLLALQFFTRIPVTGRLALWVGYSPEMLRASSAHFPGVGWLVGGWGALVTMGLLLALWPSAWASLAAAALGTAATAYVTGGFHEDGLADVADGLGGSAERERALDIMKDSRLGAYGAMALMLALLIKTALLALLGAQLPAWTVAAVLAGTHVLSRYCPLWLIRCLPHVGDTARSKSKPLADRIDNGALLAATAWALPALALLGWAVSALASLAGLLAAGLATLWLARWFARRLGGYTGDCLGAVQQVSEIAIYLALALAVMSQARAGLIAA